MNNKKAIEVIEYLRDYVNENWDEEYREKIDEVIAMSEHIIPILQNSRIVGTLNIGDKKYLISEI